MSSTSNWDVHQLPQQAGKVFLVTGASSGIGYFVAEQLATTGAEVVLAARSRAKLDLAVQGIRRRVPDARLRTVTMDLARFASIEAAVEALSDSTVHGAVFNAGVLKQDKRSQTADGHELVVGTNHLGHFVLSAHLHRLLAPGARLVTMGSMAARSARLRLDDMESVRSRQYQGFEVYKMSKLAQTMFAFELDRRLRKVDSPLISLVAHPGGALDGLTPSRVPVHTRRTADLIKALPLSSLVQGKDSAAWPAVRALLDPAAEGGQLWGPRFARTKGKPALEKPTALMQDTTMAAQLWTWTEQATGVTWPTSSAHT